jgi:hypothetical protein
MWMTPHAEAQRLLIGRDKRARVSRIPIGSRDSSLPSSEYRQCQTVRRAHSHTARTNKRPLAYTTKDRDEALM